MTTGSLHVVGRNTGILHRVGEARAVHPRPVYVKSTSLHVSLGTCVSLAAMMFDHSKCLKPHRS